MHPPILAVEGLVLGLAQLSRNTCGLAEKIHALVLPSTVGPEDGDAKIELPFKELQEVLELLRSSILRARQEHPTMIALIINKIDQILILKLIGWRQRTFEV